MRILVLAGDNPDLAAIKSALRLGEIEVLAPDSRDSCACRWAFAGWTLDAGTRELVSPTGHHVHLTSSEYDLLKIFLRRPGQTLPRDALMSAVRGRRWSYFDRSIDTLVARLRKKIGADSNRPLIRSVHGVGYVFCVNVSEAPARSPTSEIAAKDD